MAACAATGMTTPGVIVLDEDDPAPPSVSDVLLPLDWHVVVRPRAPLADHYNWVYRGGRPQPFWGFLADDVVPETPGWDTRLVEAAGPDGLAAPSGGHASAPCAPHFVLGGELVDSIGWLALPGLSRLYIDTVWHDIALERGVLRPAPDVVLRHHHFSNGRAPYDATYRKPARRADRALYDAWRRSRLTETSA